MNNSLIQIGSLGRPHGIKGEVELNVSSDMADILDKNMKIYLTEDKSLLIESIRVGNKVLVFFKDIKTRNFWEEIKYPQNIYLEKKELPKLAPGECYVFELIGLKLIDEQGQAQGEVINHYSNGAQIVLELMLTGGARMDLPYIKAFFPEFNLSENWLRFIKPEFTE